MCAREEDKTIKKLIDTIAKNAVMLSIAKEHDYDICYYRDELKKRGYQSDLLEDIYFNRNPPGFRLVFSEIIGIITIAGIILASVYAFLYVTNFTVIRESQSSEYKNGTTSGDNNLER